MTKFSTAQIHELYASEAKKHGTAGTSTIQDMRTRKLELAEIGSYIAKRTELYAYVLCCLDVGCGNGYLATQLAQQFDVYVHGIDFSAVLIEEAKKQPSSRVTFSVADVLDLDTSDFDFIYSVRCLQNLSSWEAQKVALGNIGSGLKDGGEYIMCEGFNTGLRNLNEARAELDLPAIDIPWHNNFFDEAPVIEFMRDAVGCDLIEENCFLSGYYFGSRVLLPALVKSHKPITSASRLNDYFCALPPAGDFCPMKILHFRRV